MTHTRRVRPATHVVIEVASSGRTGLSARCGASRNETSRSLDSLVRSPDIAVVGLDPVAGCGRQAPLDSQIESPGPLLSP